MGDRSTMPKFSVDRPAVQRRLDDGVRGPLTLVVAPAGSGKTFSLNQWVGSHPATQVVWLAVEPGDDEPVRFAQHLWEVLPGEKPDIEEWIGRVGSPGHGLGSSFLEELASQIGTLGDVVFIIDDLDNLSNVSLLQDLGQLAKLVHPNVHLILSTRIDLPVPWSRYRLNAGLVEIRQRDLAFDEVEAAALVEHVSGRSLTSDSIAALVKRTEGWAAGLQLAAVTLQTSEDPDEFIAELSGDDRLIAEYLSEEVLQRQTEDVRSFLLSVSVVEEICAELAEELTGDSRAQLILEQLEQDSVFLMPLDNRRHWFRFHHLFRELLRFRLRSEGATAEPDLLRRAASWHLDRGEIRTAIEYFLRARAWNSALSAIVSLGTETFEKGEMAAVIGWINQIPVPVLRARHDIELLLALLQLAEGQAVQAEDSLRRIATDPMASPGEQACARASLPGLAEWRHRPEVSISMAEDALGILGQIAPADVPQIMGLTDHRSLEIVALFSGGQAHFLCGHFEAAEQWLLRSLAAKGASYSTWRISGLGSLALTHAWCGNLEDAETEAAEALALASEAGRLSHPASAEAYLARSLVFIERGEPHRGALALHEGMHRATQNRRTHLQWIGRFGMALLQEAGGQGDEAKIGLMAAESDIGAPAPPIVGERMLAFQARQLCRDGRPDLALRLCTRSVGDLPSLAMEGATAALLQDDPPLAEKLLNMTSPPNGATQPLQLVRWSTVSALLAQRVGLEAQARLHMSASMELAERHSLIEVFVRGGPHVLQLVSTLIDRRSTLRDAILRRAREANSAPRDSTLVEPLTQRELEILSYLPSRLTNAELASRCYVSVNTVKTHVARIYRKLGVANRDEAVARAEDLGLV